MKVVDTHCDALMKLQMAKRGTLYGKKSLDYQNDESIDTNFSRLQSGQVMLQFFAIFIDEHVPSSEKWQHILEQVDLFYTDVLGKNPMMKHMTNWQDIDMLQDGEIGAVLTLEGTDGIGNDLMKLRQLYRLGVLAVGLTWNTANLGADGAGEPRGGGLTLLGKEIVKLNNEHHVFTDVSHASVQGFWDILELSDYPIASHSNVYTLCEHQRNLHDDQIKAMFQHHGLIHVVFNPPFINNGNTPTTICDLIKHIDYLCSLGGEKQIGFGSDFDGIPRKVKHLEHAGFYQHLIDELLNYYTMDAVKGFAYKNFLDHRPK